MTGRVRPWLELARVSNAPTVAANALVGAALARPDAAYPWAAAGFAAGAAGLFYVGGMILNDAFDAPRDRAFGLDRPIPAGRVSRAAAATVGAVLLVVAVLLAFAADPGALPWALGLALAIVAYDALHHVLPVTVLLMGACRALVYPLAAAMAGTPDLWPVVLGTIAVSVGLYVVVLTVAARGEHGPRPGRRRAAAVGLPLLLLPPLLVTDSAFPTLPVLAWCLVVMWALRCAHAAWRTPPDMRRAITGWIALLALADAWFLALLDRPGPAAVAVGLFLVTVAGQRRILGT